MVGAPPRRRARAHRLGDERRRRARRRPRRRGPARCPRRAGAPDPAGPVRGARRRGRARARAGERRVRRVRNRSIVNWRAVGCGTLAAGVVRPRGTVRDPARRAASRLPDRARLRRCRRLRAGRRRRATRRGLEGVSASLTPGFQTRSGLSTLHGLGRPGGCARGELAIRCRTGSSSSAVTARSRPIDGSPGDAAPDPPHRQSERRRQAGQRPATRRRPGAAASGGAGVRAPRSWPRGRAPRAGGRATTPAQLARRAADDGRDVVVGGGDGTVAPVAAALLDHPEATLGILALGSFNNIARGLRRPAHPRRRDRGDRRRPRRRRSTAAWVARDGRRRPVLRGGRRRAGRRRVPGGPGRRASRLAGAHSRPSGAGSACAGPRCG